MKKYITVLMLMLLLTSFSFGESRETIDVLENIRGSHILSYDYGMVKEVYGVPDRTNYDESYSYGSSFYAFIDYVDRDYEFYFIVPGAVGGMKPELIDHAVVHGIKIKKSVIANGLQVGMPSSKIEILLGSPTREYKGVDFNSQLDQLERYTHETQRAYFREYVRSNYRLYIQTDESDTIITSAYLLGNGSITVNSAEDLSKQFSSELHSIFELSKIAFDQQYIVEQRVDELGHQTSLYIEPYGSWFPHYVQSDLKDICTLNGKSITEVKLLFEEYIGHAINPDSKPVGIIVEQGTFQGISFARGLSREKLKENYRYILGEPVREGMDTVGEYDFNYYYEYDYLGHKIVFLSRSHADKDPALKDRDDEIHSVMIYDPIRVDSIEKSMFVSTEEIMWRLLYED